MNCRHSSHVGPLVHVLHVHALELIHGVLGPLVHVLHVQHVLQVLALLPRVVIDISMAKHDRCHLVNNKTRYHSPDGDKNGR